MSTCAITRRSGTAPTLRVRTDRILCSAPRPTRHQPPREDGAKPDTLARVLARRLGCAIQIAAVLAAVAGCGGGSKSSGHATTVFRVPSPLMAPTYRVGQH